MTVGDLGERGIIRRVVERLPPVAGTGDRVVLGPGDDAALLRVPQDRLLVATTDLLVEEVHFRLAWTPATLLGHKALAVNLSDLAAMGAVPLAFLLELGLPGRWPESELDAFLDGLGALARGTGIALAGGDTAACERLHIGLTALGTVEPGRGIRRSGGHAGDRLAVTAPLGASAAGLALLRLGWRMRPDGEAVPPPGGARLNVTPDLAARALRAHLAPSPEIAAGERLAGVASAAIDISDGLIHDLHNLCDASGCGAVVEAGRVPLDDAAEAVFRGLGLDPLQACLEGGEDYALLVAWPDAAGVPPPAARLRFIGSLTDAAAGIRLLRAGRLDPLPRRGFEHFPLLDVPDNRL